MPGTQVFWSILYFSCDTGGRKIPPTPKRNTIRLTSRGKIVFVGVVLCSNTQAVQAQLMLALRLLLRIIMLKTPAFSNCWSCENVRLKNQIILNLFSPVIITQN